MLHARRRAITNVSGAIALALIAFGALQCLDPHNPLRVGGTAAPGALPHLVNIGGIRHASGYCAPIPTCTGCHGDSLQGGPDGEPSCTKCHADHWNSPSCGTVAHTVSFDGHLHAPNYCTPLQYCARCHGSQLRGGSNGEPSCTACHGEKWTEPDCGGER